MYCVPFVKPEQSQKISDLFVKSNLYYLGPVWNGGMKNTEKEENTGIGKKCSGQTEDWKT
jgi:predicted Fe-Mo cluster-binding NifX family protein